MPKCESSGLYWTFAKFLQKFSLYSAQSTQSILAWKKLLRLIDQKRSHIITGLLTKSWASPNDLSKIKLKTSTNQAAFRRALPFLTTFFRSRLRKRTVENQEDVYWTGQSIRKTILTNVSASDSEIGAISFFQNFGATLNTHPHFHIVCTEGAFDDQEQKLKFLPATIMQTDIKKTEERIRFRVLHYLRKKKILTLDEVEKMLAKENSGFSLDGSVCIQSWDRCGLERIHKLIPPIRLRFAQTPQRSA